MEALIRVHESSKNVEKNRTMETTTVLGQSLKIVVFHATKLNLSLETI